MSSPDFAPGGIVDRRFTCDGANQAPTITWSDGPVGTAGYALTMVDPDAPNGNFVHWAVYGIAPSIRSTAALAQIPAPEGTNSAGTSSYTGPCPPAGQKHQYVVTVYALARQITDRPRRSPDQFQVLLAAAGTLRAGSFRAAYQRP